MRYIGVCVAALVLACLPCRAVAQSDVEMTVTAEGQAAVVNDDLAKAEDEALSDAKRAAVEKAIGVFVKSESLGKDFELVEQTILTRSEGYIASWEKAPDSRKIEKVDKDRLLSIQITARVKLISVVNALSDIDAIYDQIQRPKVMVLVNEKNLGQKPEDLPASAMAVMRILQDKKFDIVDPEVIKRVIAKESARVAIERGDTQAAAMLALQEGAEILVLGSANAAEQKLPEDAGDSIKAASALLSARIVYSDTGDVLYTSKQISGRGVSTSNAEEAGVKALDDAGSKLLKSDQERFAAQVIARWASELQNGRTIKVTADGVTYSEVNALKKAIADFRSHVGWGGNSTFTSGVATIYVKTKLTPDQFRDRLSAAKVNGKRVEITGVQGTSTVVELKGAAPAPKPRPKK